MIQGVALFILLVGRFPFFTNSNASRDRIADDMARQIMSGQPICEEGVWQQLSLDARDLIGRLLEVDPLKRMSMAEALKHRFLLQDDPSDINSPPA
jgi:serine/threonine protein kinase